MSTVNCIACGGKAEKAPEVTNFDDYHCPQCGRYSVNRSLIEEMKKAGKQFHPQRVRQLLAASSRTGVIPVITHIEVAVHGLIVTKP